MRRAFVSISVPDDALYGAQTQRAVENYPISGLREHPVFIRLNLLMTLVWCGLMTVNIGFAVMGVIVGGNLAKPLLSFALPMILLILGFAFNKRFPARYLARSGFQIPAASAPAA